MKKSLTGVDKIVVMYKIPNSWRFTVLFNVQTLHLSDAYAIGFGFFDWQEYSIKKYS